MPGPRGDGEGFSGLYSFNFDSGRIRCGFNQNTLADFTVNCHGVAIQPDGSEQLATSLAAGVSINWQPPQVVDGAPATVSNCSVLNQGLTQSCSVTVSDPTGTKVQMAAQVNLDQGAAGTVSKTETDTVLLSYTISTYGVTPMTLTLNTLTVNGAGSFSANNLSTQAFQGVTSLFANPSTPDPALFAQGFQAIMNSQPLFPMGNPWSICLMDNTIYFRAEQYIYRVDPVAGFVIHAGSTNPRNTNEFSHRLRIALPTESIPASGVISGNKMACGNGNIYLSDPDNHRVLMLPQSGPVQIIAGISGTSGFSGDGGSATAAKINTPDGIALGPDGSVYFSDKANYRIRKIDPQGVISTVAGSGCSSTYSIPDGAAALSACISPGSLTWGQDASLYFANGLEGIGKVNSSNNTVSAVLPYNTATALSVTADSTIYFSSLSQLYKAPHAGTPVALTQGTSGFSGDGGPATSAQVSRPAGVLSGSDGAIYFADSGNARIRKIDSSGTISTLAGVADVQAVTEGQSASVALLRTTAPGGLTVASDGSIYFSDSNRVRRIDSNGTLGTVAGNGARPAQILPPATIPGDGGPATAAPLAYPSRIAIDTDGSIYFGDQYNFAIRKIDPNGILSTFYYLGSSIPYALTFGPNHTLYYAKEPLVYMAGAHSSICRLTADATQTCFVTYDASGNLFQFGWIYSLAIGPNNTLFVADITHGLTQINLNPNSSTQVVHPLTTVSSTDPSVLVPITQPMALSLIANDLYVADGGMVDMMRPLGPSAPYTYSVTNLVGKNDKDCGGGVITNSATRAGLDAQLQASLNQMCFGLVTALGTSNSCSNGEQSVTIAFAQSFSITLPNQANNLMPSTGVGTNLPAGHSNIIKIVRPCP